MSDPTKTFADGWIANQQAFFKSMLPMSGAVASEGEVPKTPMQEQFAELQSTWKESIEKWTELVKDGPTAASFSSKALQEVFAPVRWSGPGNGMFDSGLQQVLEGPKYATLWDLDRKLAELQQLAARRDKDIASFQVIVQKAWNTALQRFSKTFASAETPPPVTWRELTDRWLSMVNETLIESHRSDAFVEAQTRMLRSASDHRLQERKLAEAWCEACHIPTRTEMDEMQRTVTELRRQLRMQRRQSATGLPLPKASIAPRKSRTRGTKARMPANT